MKNPFDVLKENNPQLFERAVSARDLAFRDGALSRKQRLLIAIALDASEGASDGVKNLARQALDAGATREEIFETLDVAYYITGVGSIYAAIRGLEEIFG